MKLRLLAGALALVLSIGSAAAQVQPGTTPLSIPKGGTGAATLTNHGFVLSHGTGSLTSIACTSAQLAIGQSSADPICRTIAGDVTLDNSGNILIGSGKVDNSRLATMAANTTKCNATGGTAAPTDCTASTMRTNMGVVIGTNVEAWDNDLDCIAALATTGQIKRTGTGTCSAGAVALSDLATGTQDTVIGYFGSTTSSATAISNCTGALTYSTATHTFGCNATAGTGNVVNSGVPTNGQIAQWTNATTIQGVGYGSLMATSASASVTAGNPAGTSSTTGVMMGMGAVCAITPTTSGRVRFSVDGVLQNNNTGITTTMNGRYGTGVAPANGAALTGTLFSPKPAAFITAANSQAASVHTEGLVGSLSIGTAYWFDISIAASSGATTSAVTNVSCVAQEF